MVPSGQRRQEFSFQGSSPSSMAAAGGAEFERIGVRMRSPLGNPMALREGEEESRWLQASQIGSPESGSGTPSPQFWGQQQHRGGGGQQVHFHRLYPASAGSSPSRAQAIAGYRREMLDLVRGLPESAYELSLRDIVESPPAPPPPPPPHPLPPPPPTPPPTTTATTEAKIAAAAAGAMDDEANKKQSKKQGKSTTTTTKTKTRKQRTRSRSLDRSASLDTGLLIKLFLPLSVGGGKKKVSPKPPASGKKKTATKKKQQQEAQQEEEWWNKGEFSEAGSSSRTSSTNSTNSSSSGGGGHGSSGGNGHGGSNPKALTNRSRSRKRIGCYGFFKANKSKNGGTED
ncbi:atherin-like [Oryza brachyantha]|uniref:atherin-like n=1 Tax=Oryza brachyantha TaxID=4533 RepID=UPI001ADD5C50|nr:atherin-like [Oryza brachyantha]